MATRVIDESAALSAWAERLEDASAAARGAPSWVMGVTHSVLSLPIDDVRLVRFKVLFQFL